MRSFEEIFFKKCPLFPLKLKKMDFFDKKDNLFVFGALTCLFTGITLKKLEIELSNDISALKQAVNINVRFNFAFFNFS